MKSMKIVLCLSPLNKNFVELPFAENINTSYLLYLSALTSGH